MSCTVAGNASGLCPHWGVHPGQDGLPHRYYFVMTDGSLGYQRIEEADVGEPFAGLEPGFGVAIVEERTLRGERYGRTNRGLWIPMRDLALARPIAFHGEVIAQPPDGGVIPFGWVIVDRAPLHTKRGQVFAPNGASRSRFQRVGYLEEVQRFGRAYVRIDETNWIGATAIRHPTMVPPPPEVDVTRHERWIDIEIATQTLIAYQGQRPAFATLVSTGKGRRPTSGLATPRGTHRIWVKLLASDMDNLENDWASRYYRIEDVPYVQYFAKGVGLHAAFWHRSFGHVRSHGCVNLAPLDAYRLFWWTSPQIPSGWTAALPTPYDRGTVIRVR